MVKKYATPLFFGLTLCLPGIRAMSAKPMEDTVIRRASVSQSLPAAASRILPLKDTVPVLFGSQSGNTMLQSYGIVRYDDIRSMPVTQLENSLYGKLAGLYLLQTSIEPGQDAATMSIRGAGPLIVIDGVPRSITSIDPEQFASVSLIKDALGTAMYGMRGENGVLLITTKHGYNGKKRISFTAQSAIQQQLKRPKFLRAFDYASLYNEALQNDGKQPIYSPADLEAWKTGNDPFGHPDVDWYNTVLKDQAGMQRYNLNIAGGGRSARYFVDLDYLNQQGYFITDSKNTYPTNNFYKRYIFRTNIDVDLTKTTLVNLNVFGRIRNGNEPGSETSGIYSSILTTPNNAYPMLNQDGSLGGNAEYTNNIYGQAVRSGYRPNYNRNLSIDLSVKQKLDVLLPGLFAKGLASFNGYYNENINRSKSFAVYNGNVKIGTDGTQSNGATNSAENRQAYTEFQLGYDSTFGAHQLSIVGLYFRDTYTDGKQLPLINSSFSARAAYSYAQKYLLEFTMAYSRNNMYNQKQWGYFPAVGIGWNIAKENWFREALPSIGTLKLRGSYGLTGNSSNAGYYTYLQFYTQNTSYALGNPATSYSGISESALANPYLTWEKAKKGNVGLDVSLLQDKLQFTAEYFNVRRTDLIMRRGTNASTIIGNTIPLENIGASTYSGMEFSADYHSRVGQLGYYVNANVSFLKSRVDDMDEVSRRYSWNERTGMPVGQNFGLVADGFYNTKDELDNHPALDGYIPVLGDLKYKDLNNDGVINVFDERAIGTTKPLVYYGLNMGLNWKGFDLSMVWQGVMNRYIFLVGNNTYEFQNSGKGQAMEHHLGRWTPATAATATYPRLTVGTNVNNHRASTFWLKDGRYLRLKNLELGYTLPQDWVRFTRLGSIRAFANAYNLLTFTPLDRVDPESYQGAYPNQRIYNFGVNIQL